MLSLNIDAVESLEINLEIIGSQSPSIVPSKKPEIPKSFSLKSKKKTNLKKKMRKASSRVNSPCKSIKSSLRSSIIQNESKCSCVTFFLKKLLAPIFFISVLIVALIAIQNYINEFCFYPTLCLCQNLGIYFYSIFREFIQFDVIVLAWSYFIAAYLTENFYDKTIIKSLFLSIEFLLLSGFFFVFYGKRNVTFLADFRIWRGGIIFFIGAVYIFLIALTCKRISKFFLRKLLKIGFFTSFYFFHSLYVKNTLSIYLLQFLLQRYEEILAKNIIKMILLIYYICYNFITKFFLFDFYQELLNDPNSFPSK